jgi:predicted membrane channel-forming protein YqfA (hemolysin III family)
MSATANRRAASATSSSDRLVAGPINVRAQLEAIAQDPKAGSRERLGALQAGGLLYTLGGLVYALRRPDPVPAVFGYHELFHALVVVAVAAQYAVVAFFVLRIS